MTTSPRAFAARAHGEQQYGRAPYLTHLDAVAALVGSAEPARTVAYLHDVAEDTAVTLGEIEAAFGAYVAECVALLTDPAGASRKERKVASHAKLATVGPSHYPALLVKAADRLANVEACVADGNEQLLAMYRREHPAFRQAVYRPDLCEPIWMRLEQLVAANT